MAAAPEAVYGLGPTLTPATQEPPMTVQPRSRPAPAEDNSLRAQLTLIGSIVAVFWVLEIVDQLILSSALDAFGIVPRDLDGLTGILAAPFLHGDFAHLASNTVPFAVLGWLILTRGRGEFFLASLLITVVGGLGVWVFARMAVHIGASGVIFGYLGYLLGLGLFERSLKAIVVAVAVGFAYGGLIWGVLPSDPRISWEAHLFGFVAGVAAARWLTQRRAAKGKTAAKTV